MKKVLTIAGSDTSGGAGLQADIKTFQELDVYGMSAITVMVAQNPNNHWAHDIYPVSMDTIAAQIDTVLGGIGVDALKTGMLPSAEIIQLVAQKLKAYGAKNIVIDPVMVCKGTDQVLNPDCALMIKKELIPIADLVTPNLFEAFQLSGRKSIKTVEDMKDAAKVIFQLGAKAVFIKGGSKLGAAKAIDIYYDENGFEIMEKPLIATSYTHGAGCTTAAAITAGLAKGLSKIEAIHLAKDFVTKGISNGFPLNQYVGATRHSANRQQADG